MRYFIYRYKDIDGNIVYIGKTTKDNIKERLSAHIDDSVGKWASSHFHTIEFLEVEKEEDMNYLESYLIRRYLPRFNIRLIDEIHPPPFEIIIPENRWINIEHIKKYEKERSDKINKTVTKNIANNIENILKKYQK